MLSPRKPIFASFRRIMVWCHDTEGYASLHPRLRATRFARAFDLSGRAAGDRVVIKQVTISLSEFGFDYSTVFARAFVLL